MLKATKAFKVDEAEVTAAKERIENAEKERLAIEDKQQQEQDNKEQDEKAEMEEVKNNSKNTETTVAVVDTNALMSKVVTREV